MAAIATLGTYRKRSFQIYIFVCLAFAAWLAYDGYFSQSFIEEHSKDAAGRTTLAFNRIVPFVLAPLAAIIAVRWWMVKDRKVVADGQTLTLENGQKIAYDRIEKIDKTHFERKGYFSITYRDAEGKETECRLSDRRFDNLEAVLVELIGALKGEAASKGDNVV